MKKSRIRISVTAAAVAVVLAASACSSGSDGKPAAASAKPVAATTAAPSDPSSAPATTAAPTPTDLPTTAAPSATPSQSSAAKSASAKPSTSKPTSAKPSTSKPATKPPAKPAGNLDPRCMTGRAMCVDKTTRKLTWVVDGVPQYSFEVRFGSAELPTREGAFSVFQKSRDHVSTLYHTSMPFAMFFSGGQAVHYSPDFAKNGYNGASHGCVNVRNKALITQLFDTVRIGDKVIVYRS
ncbi:L,D-transpeptidase [Yinghuangia aomiensis]|uniref:L,D-transpeptidase n=1 Tax=Yinghuangia aomiensis TaxID=676205 RepID=UPI0031E8DF91